MPEKEVPVKDFFEEHRRLKGERNAPQQAQPPAQPKPTAPQPPPLPSAPQHVTQPAVAQPPSTPQHVAPQPALKPAIEPEPQAQQLSFVQLVESLKSLGYDVRPLESLKGFVDLLDAEEQRLMKEISERQKRLETVRAARRLLRVLGL